MVLRSVGNDRTLPYMARNTQPKPSTAPAPTPGVPVLLTLPQIAGALGLSLIGARSAVQRLGLKRVNIGARKVRYLASDLAAALEKSR